MNTENFSVEQFAAWVKQQLEKIDLYYGHGSQDAEDEAFWLASYIANFDYQDFASEDPNRGWKKQLTESQVQKGRELLKERINTRKPLAYIINEIWFAGYRFYIDERALVPRSHLGEWVVDCFEPWINSSEVNSILDLCCGGGSIGISAALYFDEVMVDLADLSESALEVCQRNIDQYKLDKQIKAIHSDLFENIKGRYDLILCNPPYVSETNMTKLPQEYRFEPEMALVSGPEGLDSISIILSEAGRYLTDSGHLILEAGTAAPTLERALTQVPLNWMMSASGESVVLIISRSELLQFHDEINALLS